MPESAPASHACYDVGAISMATAFVFMLIIGIGTAAVFLGVVAPLVGQEKVRIVFDRSQDLNELLQRLNPNNSNHFSSIGPVCGNRNCEAEENASDCLQDCFSCNLNGECESALGESPVSCSADCYPDGRIPP
jgi:hypothetical protein